MQTVGPILTARLLFAAIAVMLGFDWLTTQVGLTYGLSPTISGDIGGYAMLTILIFIWMPYVAYKRWL